jgi:hypothetical protein
MENHRHKQIIQEYYNIISGEITSTTYWQTENNRVYELICVCNLPENGVSVYYFCDILLLVFLRNFSLSRKMANFNAVQEFLLTDYAYVRSITGLERNCFGCMEQPCTLPRLKKHNSLRA